MSDNWVVQNLQNSLDTWNEKLSKCWKLLTESPQQFKGGGIGSKYHQGLDIVFPWERRSLSVSRGLSQQQAGTAELENVSLSRMEENWKWYMGI